jgi:GT2 family glycosyltransferase
MGDNASTDDSVAFVKENYPTVRIIQNDKNYGFTGGYNRVLDQVDADYYILLNSDVEVTPAG